MTFTTARDPILSLFQSAAAAVARARADWNGPASHPLSAAADHIVAARTDPPGATPPPSAAAKSAMSCAEMGLALMEALASGEAAKRQALLDQLRFSPCDPLWIETIAEYVAHLFPDGEPRPLPYARHADIGDFVITAPKSRMRIGLLADWGTGTDEARRVAGLLAAQKPDVVIHLGDVYFAGTKGECEAHFLAPLRAVLPDAPLFSLRGNHDTYSGGSGYDDLLHRIGQPASYFCLRGPDRSWQILAGDTGLHDRDPIDAAANLTRLDPREEAWHADKLRGFPGQTVFLTHHQPFSGYAQMGRREQRDPVNPQLMASHARLASEGKIDAWFWGHEHRLRLYAPYRGVVAGRNIGYGAIPVEAAPGADAPLAGLVDPPALVVDVALDVVDGRYDHGFALLDFQDAGFEASYWALAHPAGPIHREFFTARPIAEAAASSPGS